MNSMINFTNEIYRFLGTVTISNPYMALYHKKRVESVVGEEITDRDNPYYINMMGDYYTNTIYPELSDTPMYVKSLDNFINTYTAGISGMHLPHIENSIWTTLDVFSDQSVGDVITSPGFITATIIRVISPNTVVVDKLPVDISAVSPVAITVASQAKILFHKEVLATHIKTRAYYQYNKEILADLVAKNPIQVDLIKNILFPVIINDYPFGSAEYTAVYDTKQIMFDADPISATTGSVINIGRFTLLSYSDNHLEQNELASVVTAIHDFLRVYSTRWDIPEYIEFEKYTATVFWAMLWTLLPLVILKQRVSNLHTPSVHTDMLWEYLSSKGLDDYRDILSRKQQLFLYKNIRYLLNTKGTVGTLKILAKELLEPYNIKLASKVMAQSTIGAGVTCQPVPTALSSVLGDTYIPINEAGSNEEPFQTLYDHEVDDALEPDYGPDLYDEQYLKLARLNISKIPTKLIEFISSSTHFYQGLEFIRYSIESLVYLYGEGKLGYNSSIREDTVISGVLLTMEQSILLLLYSMMQTNTTSAHITEANKDWFVDKIVIYDERRVTITAGNKDSYVGAYVEFVGSVDYPTKFGITRPFILRAGALNTDTLIDTNSYDISDILGTSMLADRDVTGDGLIDKTSLMTYLTAGYTKRVSDLTTVRTNGNKSYHRAFDFLYDQLIKRGEITIDLSDGTGYTTYEEWFANDDVVADIIAQIDARKDSSDGYVELAEEILTSMMPVMDSEFVKFGDLSSTENKLMRKLFIQMCSYDIAFFETGDLIPNYHYFSAIVHDDNVAFTQTIPMLLASTASLDESDYVDTNDAPAASIPPITPPAAEPVVNQGATQYLLQDYPDDIINREYGGIIDARLDHAYGENILLCGGLANGNFVGTEVVPLGMGYNIHGVYYNTGNEVGNPEGTDTTDSAVFVTTTFQATAAWTTYTGTYPTVYPVDGDDTDGYYCYWTWTLVDNCWWDDVLICPIIS